MDYSKLPRPLIRVKGDKDFFSRELKILHKINQGTSIRHEEGVLCFREFHGGKLSRPEFLAAVLTERELLLLSVQYDMPYATIARTEARRVSVRHAISFWDVEAVSRGFEGVEETSAANVTQEQLKVLKALGKFGPEHSVHIRIEARVHSQPSKSKTKKLPKSPGKMDKREENVNGSENEASVSSSRWRFLSSTPSSSLKSSKTHERNLDGSSKKDKKQKEKKAPQPKALTREDLGLYVIHLLTFEEDSSLQYQLRSCWLNTKLRKALKIPTAPPQSGIEIATSYMENIQNDIYEAEDDFVILEILQELCEELQVDLSVKDAFFHTHCIVLMAELLEDAIAALYNEENPPSWEDVYNQMELISAVHCVCHAAFFDCASLPSRYNVLDPSPFGFEEVLDLFLHDYTPFIPAGYCDELFSSLSAKATPRESVNDEPFTFEKFRRLSTIDSSRKSEVQQENAPQSALSKIERKLMSRSGPIPVTPAGDLKDPLLEPSYLSKTASFSSPFKHGKLKTQGTKSRMFLRYLSDPTSNNFERLSEDLDGGSAVTAVKMQKLLSALGEEIHDMQVVIMMHFRDLLFSASLDWQQSGFRQANVPPTLSQYFLHMDDLESWVNKFVARLIILVDEVDEDRLITVGKTDRERRGQPIRMSMPEASAFKAKKSLQAEQMSQTIGNAYRFSHFDDSSGSSSASLAYSNSGSSSAESDSDSSSDSYILKRKSQRQSKETPLLKGEGLIGKKAQARRQSYMSEKSSKDSKKKNKLRIDRDILQARQQAQLQVYENERSLSCVMMLYHASLLHYLQQDDTRMREVLANLLEGDIRDVISQDYFLSKLTPLLSEGDEEGYCIFGICDQLNVFSLKLVLRIIHALVPDIFIELTA